MINNRPMCVGGDDFTVRGGHADGGVFRKQVLIFIFNILILHSHTAHSLTHSRTLAHVPTRTLARTLSHARPRAHSHARSHTRLRSIAKWEGLSSFRAIFTYLS
jgi:hypothetical protein